MDMFALWNLPAILKASLGLRVLTHRHTDPYGLYKGTNITTHITGAPHVQLLPLPCCP